MKYAPHAPPLPLEACLSLPSVGQAGVKSATASWTQDPPLKDACRTGLSSMTIPSTDWLQPAFARQRVGPISLRITPCACTIPNKLLECRRGWEPWHVDGA